MAALIEQLPVRLLATSVAVVAPAVAPESWSVERVRAADLQAFAKFHFQQSHVARSSLRTDDDVDLSGVEFESLPLVASQVIRARFVKGGEMPAMYFDDDDLQRD